MDGGVAQEGGWGLVGHINPTFAYWRKVGYQTVEFLYKLQRGLQSNQNAAFQCG